MDDARIDIQTTRARSDFNLTVKLNAFPAQSARRDHIYLIDPRGNLMMRFPGAPDPYRMNKDIDRLFKAQGAA